MGQKSTKQKSGPLKTDSGKFNTRSIKKVRYSCSSTQGTRKSMEDRSIVQIGLNAIGESPAIPDIALFSVLDGHGDVEGHLAADFCSKNLVKIFQEQEEYEKFINLYLNNENVSDIVKLCFQNTFDILEDRLKEEMNEKYRRVGTTIVIALIIDNKVFIANIGDSRALLCTVNKKGESKRVFSDDHKPEDPDERDRIVEAGDTVVEGRIKAVLESKEGGGSSETKHGLSMSRALGDFDYKKKDLPSTEQSLIITADFYEWEVSDKGTFLCLASDGLWNKFDNIQVSDKVEEFGQKSYTLSQMAENLIGESLKSKDNITVILVELNKFAKRKLIPFLGNPPPVQKYFDEINKKDEPLFDDADFLS